MYKPYCCPEYKNCKWHGSLFNCTHARRPKKGEKVLKSAPACFKDKRRASTIEKEEEVPVKKAPKKKAPAKKAPKTTNLVISGGNIWDDIPAKKVENKVDNVWL